MTEDGGLTVEITPMQRDMIRGYGDWEPVPRWHPRYIAFKQTWRRRVYEGFHDEHEWEYATDKEVAVDGLSKACG